MVKLTLVTQTDLPNGAPKPSEYRSPGAPLRTTRVHTWLCSTTDEAAWTLTALASACVIGVEVHGAGRKGGYAC